MDKFAFDLIKMNQSHHERSEGVSPELGSNLVNCSSFTTFMTYLWSYLRIFNYLENCVCTNEDPRQQGKASAYNKSRLWRYRVGDYRIICQIEDETLIILVLSVGHRK